MKQIVKKIKGLVAVKGYQLKRKNIMKKQVTLKQLKQQRDFLNVFLPDYIKETTKQFYIVEGTYNECIKTGELIFIIKQYDEYALNKTEKISVYNDGKYKLVLGKRIGTGV